MTVMELACLSCQVELRLVWVMIAEELVVTLRTLVTNTHVHSYDGREALEHMQV